MRPASAAPLHATLVDQRVVIRIDREGPLLVARTQSGTTTATGHAFGDLVVWLKCAAAR